MLVFADVAAIDRLGDPVWQGLVIGALAGATAGAIVPRRGCGNGGSGLCIGGPALLAAALGAWIDHTVVGRRRVYPPTTVRSTRAYPIVIVAPTYVVAGVTIGAR
jgi:hypothetical protein